MALGIVAWGVGGLGIGLAYAPLSMTTLSLARPGREGTATSALQLSDVLGGAALGTGIGGVVVAGGARAGWGPRPGILLVFAMALTVSLIGVVLSRRLPLRLGAGSASRRRVRRPGATTPRTSSPAPRPSRSSCPSRPCPPTEAAVDRPKCV